MIGNVGLLIFFTETETPFSNQSTTHGHEAAAEAFPLVYKGHPRITFPTHPISVRFFSIFSLSDFFAFFFFLFLSFAFQRYVF